MDATTLDLIPPRRKQFQLGSPFYQGSKTFSEAS